MGYRLCLLVSLLCWGIAFGEPPRTVHIGVLAFDGEERALARWQPLAGYLSARIPGYTFRVLPLTHEGFRNRIRKDQLDFVLTNPAHYVQLEVSFGVTRILTLRNRHAGRALTRFGAVIFTRADSGIHTPEDLRGQRLAAVSPEAFGGFLLARHALRETGIDPLHEMHPLWLGFPQHEIVQAVLEGRADAGTVRTGVIEGLITAGRLDPKALRILLPRPASGFPLRLSTSLYPEWPLARLPRTDEALARQVTLQLLQMPADGPVARAASIAGWTIPLDYNGVHEVLRTLQAPPYTPRPLSLAELWHSHATLLGSLLTALLLGLGSSLYILRINRELQRSQQALERHRDELEQLVEQRTEALLAANRTLQDDIATRIRQEEALHDGCDCLHSIHTLIVRDDLSPEQRLQSILDHLAAYFGTRHLLLHRVRKGRPEYCAASPPDSPPAVLDAEAAARAVAERAPLEREFAREETTMRYLACPVVQQGKALCVLELLAEQQAANKLERHNELGMRILQLVAQWLAYEEQNRLREQHRALAVHRLAGLTPREHEVLIAVSRGLANKQIARELGISVKTVELHRSNLMRKLGLGNAAELTRLAMQAGLLDAEDPSYFPS